MGIGNKSNRTGFQGFCARFYHEREPIENILA